jgi:hypothetical protein
MTECSFSNSSFQVAPIPSRLIRFRTQNPYATPQADSSPPLKVRKIGRHHSPYGSYREIGWLHYTVVGLLLAGVGVAAAQIITIEQINEKMRTYDIETGDLTSIENLERTSGGIAMMSGAVMLHFLVHLEEQIHQECLALLFTKRSAGNWHKRTPDSGMGGWILLHSHRAILETFSGDGLHQGPGQCSSQNRIAPRILVDRLVDLDDLPPGCQQIQ